MRAKCPEPWTDQAPDLDPTKYDPLEDHSACIQQVLEDLFVDSPCVLFDQFDLPPVGGATIAQAIRDGEALAISDGSFDDSPQVGSYAFIISPSQKADAEFLEGANLFAMGLPMEQIAYQSELARVLGVVFLLQ